MDAFFAENVHTGVNFVDKIESCAMVRFIRVTFVRPAKNVDPKNSNYHPPGGFSYKTFIPCAVKVGMCSGAPEYESFSYTWERSRAWLKIVGESESKGQCLRRVLLADDWKDVGRTLSVCLSVCAVSVLHWLRPLMVFETVA